jgi:hypothetical protein
MALTGARGRAVACHLHGVPLVGLRGVPSSVRRHRRRIHGNPTERLTGRCRTDATASTPSPRLRRARSRAGSAHADPSSPEIVPHRVPLLRRARGCPLHGLVSSADRVVEPPRLPVPSSWFRTTSTAYSTRGVRACCSPVPDLGFAGFRHGPGVASEEASAVSALLTSAIPSEGFPSPVAVPHHWGLLPSCRTSPTEVGFAPRRRCQRVAAPTVRRPPRGHRPVARAGVAGSRNHARPDTSGVTPIVRGPISRPARADGRRRTATTRIRPSNPGRARLAANRAAGPPTGARRHQPTSPRSHDAAGAGSHDPSRTRIRRSGRGRLHDAEHLSGRRRVSVVGRMQPIAPATLHTPLPSPDGAHRHHEGDGSTGRLQGLAPPTSP